MASRVAQSCRVESFGERVSLSVQLSAKSECVRCPLQRSLGQLICNRHQWRDDLWVTCVRRLSIVQPSTVQRQQAQIATAAASVALQPTKRDRQKERERENRRTPANDEACERLSSRNVSASNSQVFGCGASCAPQAQFARLHSLAVQTRIVRSLIRSFSSSLVREFTRSLGLANWRTHSPVSLATFSERERETSTASNAIR